MRAAPDGQSSKAWLGVSLLVVLALGFGGWWFAKRHRDDATGVATVPTPPVGKLSASTHTEQASPPTRVIRLSGGAEERRQLAQRIAAAQAARRAAASPSAGSSSSRTAPPELPAGSGSMDSADQVLAQMQNALEQVKAHVTTCVDLAGVAVPGFKADLALNGDPDIGTLIDAGALMTVDGKPLPAQFDDCVRGVMQSLELPVMAVGDEFKVSYEFLFGDTQQ